MKKLNTITCEEIMTVSVDSVVHGSEHRITRNLFGISVKLGKISHMMTAENNIDEQTMRKLHAMRVDEARRINGIISYESVVKFQQEDK